MSSSISRKFGNSRRRIRIKNGPHEDDHDDHPIITRRSRSRVLSTSTSTSIFPAPVLLLFLLLLLAINDSRLLFTEGLSSSFSSSSSSSSSSPSQESSEPSPWASSSWLLQLDFGQPSKANNEETPTTAYSNVAPFSSYGASGSRLVVTCPVMIEADDDVNNKKIPDTFVGRGASVIRARDENDKDGDGDGDGDGTINSNNDINDTSNNNNNNDFKYITMQGSQRIEFSPGGWTLQFPPGGKANRGRASKLRFYVDLTTDMERNDVALPAGTRLYFAASAWREMEYENYGLTKMRPIRRALEEAQRVLDERLSHDTGDRRLDGTDPIETLRAYRDMTALVLDRDRKRTALREALDQDGHGYPASDDHPEGPWPGSTEWLTLSENNPIYARVPKKNDVSNNTNNNNKSSKNSDDKKNNRNLLQQLIKRGGEKEYQYGRVGTWTGEAISSLLLED